jgi:stage V sporulation protein D (sporulation-specific penicillin-binding protein)
MKGPRLNIVFFVFFLFAAAIAGRLFYIQIIKNGFYMAMAQGQQQNFQMSELKRGEVFFKNGEILATNNGIAREYPQGKIASQVIGFLGGEGLGQYGIEGFYDEILSGSNKSFSPGETIKGSDIFLTIDYNIQFAAEKLLEKAKNDLKISSGQIIIMDPFSGKIIALANFPNFDPNKYSEEKDFSVFQNSAIQKFYEPGSTFKPITMSAVMNEGKIDPDTTYTDKGFLKIGPDTISNYGGKSYGVQTMTQVLEKSINTGAVYAESQIGHDIFLDYINKFGFFAPTQVGLQGEVSSANRELKKGYELNFATASFGQGIEITPLQLIRAFCAIANGGKLVQPKIIEKIIGGDSELSEGENRESVQIIFPETALKVANMMLSVIENGPYTKAAKIAGYYAAGKTGTAQITWSALGINKKGYSDKTWQSFVGFAPAFDPKFVILIKLDDPNTKTAEYSAVPIFKEMAEYIINYWKIPPDYDL